MRTLSISPARLTRGIREGTVPIAVVGLGHVGLPLALLFASEGARVTGCDLEGPYLEKLRRGISPIVEHSSNRFADQVLESFCPTCGVRLLKEGGEAFCPNCMKVMEMKNERVRLTRKDHRVSPRRQTNEMQELLWASLKAGRLSLTSDTRGAVARSGVVIVCVGTPIDERKRPDLRALLSASAEIGKGLKKGALVILKSTVSPGTTEDVFAPILERESGMKAGRDFGLAHVPETTIEGLALLGHRTLPKTVGGVDKRSAELASAVFRVFDVPVYVFDSPKTTEAAKLFQNIYRDANVALVNELALASETLGLDIAHVLEAARTEPKTHLLTPGPGVGGYCLPKDAYYLTAPAAALGFQPRILSVAREVNDSMPGHVVELVKDACAESKVRPDGARAAVLGVSFKANTADMRDSPSIPVLSGLSRLGMRVTAHDPLADLRSVKHILKGTRFVEDLKSALRTAEVAVLLTDHLEYRALTGESLSRLAPKLKVVVDTRQVFDPEDIAGHGYVYRGVGRVPSKGTPR